MPIEFDCVHCGSRMRVPDGLERKTGSCPNCGKAMEVPSVADEPQAADLFETQPWATNQPGSPIEPPPWAPASDSDLTTNPYATPATVAAPEEAALFELGLGTLQASVALESAWPLFKQNAWLLIGSLVSVYAISFVFSILGALLLPLAAASGITEGGVLTLSIGFQIFNQLLSLWLTIGLVIIALHVVRHQPASWSMLFSGARYLLTTVFASLLFGALFMLGLLCLIIPAFYVAATFWPFMYFIVDRDAGIVESLELANQHTKGNKLQSVLLGFISMGLGILGVLALLVGVLISYSMTMLMFATAYLMITGEFARRRQLDGESPFADGAQVAIGENPFAD